LHAPLLAPGQAAKLLDDLLYERVLGCVDLQALFIIEVDLWVALCECEIAADDDAAKQIAKAMIDRALRRLPDEERRYSLVRPFGTECPDCEDERLDAANSQRRRKSG
jgi:hypothetical protein